MSSPRLPRYRRATEVPCVLTPRDLEILKIVQSFRLVTSEMLQALVEGSNQGLLRRLQKLFHAGYLDRIPPRRINGGGSAKMIYASTNRGVRLLQKAGAIQRLTQTDWNAQNRGLDGLFVDHTLLVSHIRTVLTLVCRAYPDFELAAWREGDELRDHIEVALEQGYARVPVAPDAFFTLRDAKGRLNYLLEADRGTMTVKRFTLKLKAYAAWHQEEKHQAKLDIKHFRVLTVTQSPVRLENLVRAAEMAEDVRRLGRRFLFAPEENLYLARPKSVLENIWSWPGGSEPVSLLGEAPAKTQQEGG